MHFCYPPLVAKVVGTDPLTIAPLASETHEAPLGITLVTLEAAILSTLPLPDHEYAIATV